MSYGLAYKSDILIIWLVTYSWVMFVARVFCVVFCRWLFVIFLLTIVLSILLWFTDSDCSFGIFWPLCCLSFFDLQILIAPLVSFDHCVVYPSLIYRFWLVLWYLLTIVLSILLWFTDSDCSFGIFWPLCCLSFFDLQILIAPLVSFGHCVVYPSLIYRFWLLLWYLQTLLHNYNGSRHTLHKIKM
jgi:hypothetical protein